MISCIVIEDQEPAQAILKRFIKATDKLRLLACFTNAIEALEYLKNHPVDLIFLDIHLPKVSGMDFLKVLHNPPHIILTTAFSEYALQSYDFDVVDYLLKPFSFERFSKAISKVHTRMASPESYRPIVVKDGFDRLQIQPETIHYIQADGDYTIVYFAEKKSMLSYPLKFWIEQLPSDLFKQIHKSYIVNLRQIQKVSKNQVHMTCNLLPIGRVYKHEFIQQYERSLNSKL